jgi:hypothetical protein
MHVVPFLLVVLILCSLALAGYGTVEVLGRSYPAARRWLLMPFAGLALYAVVATCLSRAGLPVKAFAAPLLIGLLLPNLAYGIFRLPQVRWRTVAPWCGALLVALLFVGWPLLVSGTNWVSTANGDMTVYVLGADHFYEHGFYQVPSIEQLDREVDRSWDLSFNYSMGQVRFASQLILASFMALSGFNGAQSFMIVIAALHVVVIMTAAALVFTLSARMGVALAVFVVIALSANLVLGTFIQLIAQDFGIAALSASALVLEVPPKGSSFYARAGLCGLFIAALFLAYPELSPFLCLSLLIFLAIALYREPSQWSRLASYLGLIGLVALLFVNTNLLGALHLILLSAQHGVGNDNVNALFPYYLTPLGFPLGWGILAYGSSDASSVRVQLCALVGAAMYLAALVISCRLAWRLEPAAIVASTMLLFFFYLFATQNGFGLFKLAMYAQPFVLASLTIWISALLPTVFRATLGKIPA